MEKPSAIIPIPKSLELEPTARPWPGRVELKFSAAMATALGGRFERELFRSGNGSLSMTLKEGEGPREGYQIAFDEGGVTVTAANTAGFRHALETLKQIASDGVVPVGKVRDAPDLSVRGFHINLQNCRRLDTDAAARLLRAAGELKLNAVLLEYGGRFPFESHSEVRDPAAHPAEDIQTLVDVAKEQGIRIIPLQQSLAHLEYALGHGELASLRERAEKASLMCPSNPGSLELFKSLAGEIIGRHPGAEWFHIGGDEARKIGSCPTCAEGINSKR